MRRAAKTVATGLGGLLGLALALLPGSAAVAAAEGGPCGQPNALLQAGDYAAAYAAFALVRPASSSCARQGLAAAGALQAASQLIGVGLVTDADAEIVRAVDADPALSLPPSLLTKAGAGRALSLAETLDAEGFHQQAVQILLFITETHPGVTLDPAAQRILNPPGEPWWDDILHFAFSWAGGVSVIAVLFVIGTFYPLTRRRLHLQPFTLADADTGADAKRLHGQVNDELRHLATEQARTALGGQPRIDVAGPYDEPLDIGQVVGFAIGPVQIVYTVVGLLIKRYPKLCLPRLVTGALRPSATLEVAIATVDGKTECSEVIAHKDFSFPPLHPSVANRVEAKYAQLALPAAAWVILNRYHRYTLGGTRDLDSFMKFVTGYAWHQEDQADEAEHYYQQARRADPRNTAATVNLARLWQQREVLEGASGSGDSRSSKLLRSVAEATRSNTADLQWYRSRYLLSLGLSDNKGPARSAAEEEERRQAFLFAVDVAIKVMEQLHDPDAAVPRGFLENSEGPALALAVSQMIPSTENRDEIVTIGFVPDDVTDDDVLRELRKARAGGNVAPEILVPYIERCPPDAEVDYNLYRFQVQRQQACEEAIATLQEELREVRESAPASGSHWEPEATRQERRGGGPGLAQQLRVGPRLNMGGSTRERELLERLEGAKSAAQAAGAAADRYAERLSDSEDPVLQARFDAIVRAARPYEANYPSWSPPGYGGYAPDERDIVREGPSDRETGGESAPPGVDQTAGEWPDDAVRGYSPAGPDTNVDTTIESALPGGSQEAMWPDSLRSCEQDHADEVVIDGHSDWDQGDVREHDPAADANAESEFKLSGTTQPEPVPSHELLRNAREEPSSAGAVISSRSARPPASDAVRESDDEAAGEQAAVLPARTVEEPPTDMVRGYTAGPDTDTGAVRETAPTAAAKAAPAVVGENADEGSAAAPFAGESATDMVREYRADPSLGASHETVPHDLGPPELAQPAAAVRTVTEDNGRALTAESVAEVVREYRPEPGAWAVSQAASPETSPTELAVPEDVAGEPREHKDADH